MPHICNLLGDPNSQVSFCCESHLKVVLVALLVNELIVLLVVSSEQCCARRTLGWFWRGIIWSMSKPAYQLLQGFSRTTWMCRWDEEKRETFVGRELLCLGAWIQGGCRDLSGLSAAPLTFKNQSGQGGQMASVRQPGHVHCRKMNKEVLNRGWRQSVPGPSISDAMQMKIQVE